MARLCDAIQRAAASGNMREAASLLAGLAGELSRAEIRLQGWLAPMAGNARICKEGMDA